MIEYLEWRGMLDQKNWRMSGVTGPLVNHRRKGKNMSSLRSDGRWTGVRRGNTPAAKSVFLPSIQLVVAGQRDTFFEFAARVGSPSNVVALTLATVDPIDPP